MQVKSIAEHSAIILTFIKLPFAIKTFVLSILDWPLKTGFTVEQKRAYWLCTNCPKQAGMMLSKPSCRWVDKVGMHMYATFDENIPCG